jgi:hypothetical protein
MNITKAEAAALGRKRKPTPRRESVIQAAILGYLKLVPGVVAWKNGTASYRATYKGKERFVRIGKRGVSDILGWRTVTVSCGMCATAASGGRCTCSGAENARFLAIEVKRPGKQPTPEQIAFLANVTRAGGIAILATSVEDVQAALARGGGVHRTDST